MADTFVYMPLLRTRAAELKAYEVLSDDIKNHMVPVFELTRARRSKYDGEGDINKNIARIKESVGSRPFALDLTVTEQLSNRAINGVLEDGRNGFDKWVELLEEFDNCNIIPAIHIDPEYLSLLDNQVNKLRSIAPCLLLRLSIKEEEMPIQMLADFVEQVSETNDVALLLDRAFIDLNDDVARKSDLDVFCEACECFGKDFRSISYSSSSFPSSVVKPGYGGDSYGYFKLSEVAFFDQIIGVNGTTTTCYSDYASVHPLFYPGGGGGWVPRVDYPREEDLFYHRYRREDGGYIKAAQEVVKDRMYHKHDDWGCNEIEWAAQGAPNGSSPAHWISVRMSLHMTRQVERLRTNTHSRFEL